MIVNTCPVFLVPVAVQMNHTRTQNYFRIVSFSMDLLSSFDFASFSPPEEAHLCSFSSSSIETLPFVTHTLHKYRSGHCSGSSDVIFGDLVVSFGV